MVTRNPKCRAGTEEERKAANSIYSKRITKWELAQDVEVSGDLTKKYLGLRESVINTSSPTVGAIRKDTAA